MGHYRVPASKKFPQITRIVFRIENERDWLYSRGGRTTEDVFWDEKGRFVYMTNYDGTGKVYIPIHLK